MPLDIDQLITDIKDVVSQIVAKDATTIHGFSDRQLTGIANQAKLVAAGIVSGDVTDSNRDFFLDQLVQLTHNFVRALVGLLTTTIEKIWNAIVGVIWKAISKIVGFNLPSPNII
jgi:hypothetical protein